jgi:transcriptional regulator with XRE-family HTH domain
MKNLGVENYEQQNKIFFKNIIRKLRKNASLTQKQASEIMGVDISTWERYEAGKTMPKIHFIELFCIKTKQDFNELENIMNQK